MPGWPYFSFFSSMYPSKMNEFGPFWDIAHCRTKFVPKFRTEYVLRSTSRLGWFKAALQKQAPNNEKRNFRGEWGANWSTLDWIWFVCLADQCPWRQQETPGPNAQCPESFFSRKKSKGSWRLFFRLISVTSNVRQRADLKRLSAGPICDPCYDLS